MGDPDFLTYYERLPDGMEAPAVLAEFNKLFLVAESGEVSPYDICNALYELANKQYHTYTPLDAATKDKIAAWVERNWLGELRFVRNLGMIAGGIGIRRICELLKEKQDGPLPPDVREEIEGVLKEVGPNVDDPYFDLR